MEEKKKKKRLENMWSADDGQVLKLHSCTLGCGAQYTDKTNTNDVKMGNSLIEEMRVRR